MLFHIGNSDDLRTVFTADLLQLGILRYKSLLTLLPINLPDLLMKFFFAVWRLHQMILHLIDIHIQSLHDSLEMLRR